MRLDDVFVAVESVQRSGQHTIFITAEPHDSRSTTVPGRWRGTGEAQRTPGK